MSMAKDDSEAFKCAPKYRILEHVSMLVSLVFLKVLFTCQELNIVEA